MAVRYSITPSPTCRRAVDRRSGADPAGDPQHRTGAAQLRDPEIEQLDEVRLSSVRVPIALKAVCAALFFTSSALAGPGDDYQRAKQLDESGDYEDALASIAHGLAAAPRDRPLLALKGSVLLKLRDFLGALAAYRAYLAAGATGANRREVEKIVERLRAAESTSIDITVENGPATIYLDSKTLGAFCASAPSCKRPMLPDDYKVIAERDGFEPWTGRVTVRRGETTPLAITLVEKPSLLTIRTTPPGATVMVDEAAFPAPATVAAGSHWIAVSFPGYATELRDVAVHQGKPAEVEIALTRLVQVRVTPRNAQLTLDGKPFVADPGGAAISPGTHVVVAHAPGFHDRRIDVPAVRDPGYELVVELDRLPPAAPATAPEPDGLSGRRKLALAAGGVATIAAVGGLFASLESSRLDLKASAQCPSPASCTDPGGSDQNHQRARSRAILAGLAFGTTGAAAIAAAVLWWTGRPAPRVAVTPRADSAGIDLVVTF